LVEWAEVLPEYRGQRVAEALQIGSHRIARQRNIAWNCGVVAVANSASLAAHLQPRRGTEDALASRGEGIRERASSGAPQLMNEAGIDAGTIGPRAAKRWAALAIGALQD
jgi:hypothetical protein